MRVQNFSTEVQMLRVMLCCGQSAGTAFYSIGTLWRHWPDCSTPRRTVTLLQETAGVRRGGEPLLVQGSATNHDGRLVPDGELNDLDKNVKFLCGLWTPVQCLHPPPPCSITCKVERIASTPLLSSSVTDGRWWWRRCGSAYSTGALETLENGSAEWVSCQLGIRTLGRGGGGINLHVFENMYWSMFLLSCFQYCATTAFDVLHLASHNPQHSIFDTNWLHNVYTHYTMLLRVSTILFLAVFRQLQVLSTCTAYMAICHWWFSGCVLM
jgi:hypothetical protein